MNGILSCSDERKVNEVTWLETWSAATYPPLRSGANRIQLCQTLCLILSRQTISKTGQASLLAAGTVQAKVNTPYILFHSGKMVDPALATRW